MNIQIVEDDRALREGIAMALKEPELCFVQNSSIRQAMEAFLENTIDLVILDVNLPDGSGYDYLKWLRERSQIGVLMLTANDMEMDEVLSLSLGADDYMTKPFSLAVLRARIHNLLRRRGFGAQKDNIEIDEFRFDFDKLIFLRGSEKITLSLNEQKLLRILVENRERLLTRDVLMERIWCDEGEFVDENALSVTMNRLRNKLERKADTVTYIQTIYGQGYMWRKVLKE